MTSDYIELKRGRAHVYRVSLPLVVRDSRNFYRVVFNGGVIEVFKWYGELFKTQADSGPIVATLDRNGFRGIERSGAMISFAWHDVRRATYPRMWPRWLKLSVMLTEPTESAGAAGSTAAGSIDAGPIAARDVYIALTMRSVGRRELLKIFELLISNAGGKVVEE